MDTPLRAISQPERFIDQYRFRNEPLADLIRRFGVCEEKGSGIDKVVQAVE
jgi:ATP-dependent DNA helicase RecG